MTVSQAYDYLFVGTLIVLGICLFFVILKSIIGPRISDRIVTINMVGTIVTSCIATLSVYLVNETYLIDVCLIYVLISFISVIVLTNVFINEYLNKKEKNKKDGDQ